MAFRPQMHQSSSFTGSFKFLAEKCLSLAVMSCSSHRSRYLRIAQNKAQRVGRELVFPDANADMLW